MSGYSGPGSTLPRFLQATKASAARENSRLAQSAQNTSQSSTNIPSRGSSRERDSSATRRNVPKSTTVTEPGKGGVTLKRSNSMPSKQVLMNRSDKSNQQPLRDQNFQATQSDHSLKKPQMPVIKGGLVTKPTSAKPVNSSRENRVSASGSSDNQKVKSTATKIEPRSSTGVPVIKPSLKRAESSRVPSSKKPYVTALSSTSSSSTSSNTQSAALSTTTSINRVRIKSCSGSTTEVPKPKVQNSNQEEKMDHCSTEEGHAEGKHRNESTSSTTADKTITAEGKENENEERKADQNQSEVNANMSTASSTSAISAAGGEAKKLWSLQDFEFGKILGRGRFGLVYVAREKQSKFIVAIKVLFKKDLESSQIIRQVKREIQVQSHLKHPHILRLYSYFQDEERLYIVLDYASNGELYKFLKQRGSFSENVTAKYIYQLTSALIYLQQKNVIHRDLKPENLLLDNRMDLKIADFGWTVHSPDLPRSTLCGTPDYLSPEMLLGQEYSVAVDIWSMGVLCYEFLHGKPPFETSTIAETYERIKKVDIIWPESISADARRFIGGLLKFDPKQRTPLAQVQQDPWILANYKPPEHQNASHGSGSHRTTRHSPKCDNESKCDDGSHSKMDDASVS